MTRVRTLHDETPAERSAGSRARLRSRAGQSVLRRVSIVLMLFLAVSLVGPLSIAPAIAQDEAPAAEVVAQETSADKPATTDQPPAEPTVEEQVQPVQQAPAPPPTGSLEIRLTGTNGVGLSGLFAVTDAAGAYHERWTKGGVAWFPALVAGTATISQRSGATDYAFDGATPSYIDVPAGGHATLPIVNAFLDADGDGVGDSVDICGAGNDAVDTDADTLPDACDATPTGDTDGDGIDELTDPTPNGDDDADGVDNATDACPTGDDAIDTNEDGAADACDDSPGGDTPAEPDRDETSTVVAEIAPDPVVVEGATITCDQLSGLTPTIASDLAAYAPGAVVTLTGAGWAPGQVVTIDVDDDGTVDAAVGAWSLTAEATVNETGSFSYQLTLPEPVAAAYRVVATVQCSAPEETSEIVAAVAAEPEVVKDAPVTCKQADAVAPWILTDLADYPPGARVTLTGGNWVAGQTIELLVEDDGIADAERGPWSHTATVTADAQGTFTYQFDLAPWFVADYSVVATGECSEARTTFTDANAAASVTPTSVQAGASQTFTVKITNQDSSWEMCSAKLLIPAGFSTPPSSVSFSGTGFKGSNNGWTHTFSTDGDNPRKMVMKALNGDGCIDKGTNGFLNVTFTVTAPTTAGNRTFTTEAWKSSDHGSDKFTMTTQPVVTVTAASGPCTPTIGATGLNVNFGTSTWGGSAYPTKTGALAIQITSSGSGCSGFPTSWSVQASTSVMDRTGGGGTIPATALGYTGTSSGSPPTGLTPSAASPLGGTAQTIATGIATTSTGTWNAGFSLAPPATASPGAYTGTITITAATGS